MDPRYHLQTTGLARVPVRLMALAAVGLVAIAPAALAQGNDGWSNASNGTVGITRAVARRRPGN